MAFVIFGAELYQFHSAMITMRTLFLMLLGAFEYEEMAEVHPFMAPAVRLIVCLAMLCILFVHSGRFWSESNDCRRVCICCCCCRMSHAPS